MNAKICWSAMCKFFICRLHADVTITQITKLVSNIYTLYYGWLAACGSCSNTSHPFKFYVMGASFCIRWYDEATPSALYPICADFSSAITSNFLFFLFPHREVSRLFFLLFFCIDSEAFSTLDDEAWFKLYVYISTDFRYFFFSFPAIASWFPARECLFQMPLAECCKESIFPPTISFIYK